MKSIIQDDEKRCYFCGKTQGLETHHVFGGVANRPISQRFGLTVKLCAECHRGQDGAQSDKARNRQLKQDAQYAFERTHKRAEWMRLIGKNYL